AVAARLFRNLLPKFFRSRVGFGVNLRRYLIEGHPFFHHLAYPKPDRSERSDYRPAGAEVRLKGWQRCAIRHGRRCIFFSILLLEGLVMLMSKHRARPDRLPRPRRAQLQLESLEDRCLLSNDGLSQLAGWLPADAVAPSSTVKVKATYVAPADSLDGVVIS